MNYNINKQEKLSKKICVYLLFTKNMYENDNKNFPRSKQPKKNNYFIHL